VRHATPENVDALKKELEDTMLQNLAECGSQIDKVKEEAMAAGQFADQRVNLINEQKKQAEEQRLKDEQERVETEAATKKLLEEAETKVKAVEEEGAKLEEVKKPLTEDDVTLDTIREIMGKIKDISKANKEVCKVASDFINQNRLEMDKARSIAHETRPAIVLLQRRIGDVQSQSDRAFFEAKQHRDKAVHK